ncbi:MAG: SCO family protein [Candidatus Kapabacteria bacterium]|nr:SCO family protein [Candidatus Kapabacteria bacterium]MDW8225122.1 SCO family protein [Bacteroidota bacterium]
MTLGRVWLLILLFVTGCTRYEESVHIELPEYFPAPRLSGVTAEGTAFSTDSLRGRVYIVSFFFTSCTGPCPTMNSRLSVLQSVFADVPDVRFVSITVDPTRDRPSVLKHYATRYGAKSGRWYFVNMPSDSVEWAATQGFRVPGSAKEPDLHSVRLILVDRRGIVRGFFSATDEAEVKKLEQAIHQLLREGALDQ